MKRRTAIAAVMLVAAVAGAARAEDGIYIGGLIGGVSNADQDVGGRTGSQSVSLRGGADLSIFVGYDFGRIGGAGSLRTELQFSGRASEPHGARADTGTYSEDATFLNVYHDFDMHEGAVWVPYLGAGIGHGRIEYDDYRKGGTAIIDGADTVWGEQAIVGIGYQVSDKVRVFADYRYRNWQDTKLNDATGTPVSTDNTSLSINLGASYTF
jgi:opacity protein-like surface antigen